MSWNGFEDLDLSGVEAETGSARLPVGNYRVRCTKASIEGTKGGAKTNRMVVVDLVCKDGNGDIKHNFNVNHTSAEAQRIGLAQFKGFLEVSGHPSPDKPGAIASLEGLECVISVGYGKPWTNDKGQTVTSTEIKKFLKPDAPARGPSGASAPEDKWAGKVDKTTAGTTGSRRTIDDEIPF